MWFWGYFFLHFSTIAWNTFIKKKVKFITKRKVLRNKDKLHDALSYTVIVNCGHIQDRLLPCVTMNTYWQRCFKKFKLHVLQVINKECELFMWKTHMTTVVSICISIWVLTQLTCEMIEVWGWLLIFNLTREINELNLSQGTGC